MVALARNRHLVTIRCESAGEFLDVLDPLNGYFAGGPVSDYYIFRGVKSSEFELVPSAFRSDVELPFLGGYYEAPLDTQVAQCAAELLTLRNFFEIAARQGIRLPEDSPTLRETINAWVDLLTYDVHKWTEPPTWPPTMFYSLIGLAQHHGIPTRALDWTWSSLTAAYFATDIDPIASDDVAVWAFNRVFEEIEKQLGRGQRAIPGTDDLVIFTAPEADNDNLRAQRGVFMLHSHQIREPNGKFEVSRYDELLLRKLPRVSDSTFLYKITLPAKETLKVRSGLRSAGVTAGSLFPGLWGAAREYRESRALRSVNEPVPRNNTSAVIHAELMKPFVANANRGA